MSGTLISPYSGRRFEFVRGPYSALVPIDHVVALGDAWQKGAQQWTIRKRERFANNFIELRATDIYTNSSKGDSDAATWLPPQKSSRCQYVARQIAVKREFGLWVTKAERRAMARVLTTCPHEPLPSVKTIPLGAEARK